jgi:hypothetical protein
MYDYKLNDDSNYIDIYWAPYWNQSITYDLNHLYPSPRSLYSDCLERYVGGQKRDTFIKCPAVSNKMKKTFIFENIVENHTTYVGNEVIYANPDALQTPSGQLHEPTLDNNLLINFNYSLLLFAEESVTASMTSPYFHNVESNQYGMLVPGEFDIGKWYRPMNAEFNLWDGVNELHIGKNEPLMYIQFHTDKQIRLHRYQVTKRLSTIALSLIHINPLSRFAKLTEKYELFRKASLRSQILNEIKNNIVDTQCE